MTTSKKKLPKHQKITTEEAVEAYYVAGGNIAEAARQLNVGRASIHQHLDRAGVKKPVAAGSKTGHIKTVAKDLPKPGKVKRYIATCAQNNTLVHDKVLKNLEALAKFYDAEILCSRITYNISSYSTQPAKPGAVKGGRAGYDENTKKAAAVGQNIADPLWYDPTIEDYVCDERVELAPGLLFCGELNIMPTAVRPLSGLETYTGRSSMIAPHNKLALESIASGKNEDTKFNYTTGTVTQMSYIQRKAGQKAEEHHCYGGLLVEVDDKGGWWVRQLNADRQSTIYDLNVRAKGGKVAEGDYCLAINWGDVHEDEMDEEVRDLAWAPGGMIDTLRPRYQFMHDALNFGRRNHHDRKDCHKMFELFIQGRESVQQEVENLVAFLNAESYRNFCTTVIVNSNHDNALERWLREADYRKDHVNALYFLTLQKRKYEAIAEQDDGFYILEWAAKELGCRDNIRWLREDEDLVLKGIKFDIHGHLGIDGARGSPASFAKMGRKANTGHTHKTGIIDGVYTAGTCVLNPSYARGPSSSSHSHILTYTNGKRAIVTMWNNAWRAK